VQFFTPLRTGYCSFLSFATQPFIVSADIARAFDNIKLDKLMQIVQPSLSAHEYSVIR